MPAKAIIPPKNLIIEPTNICDQHCPTCPTGSGKSKREKRNMSFEEFKSIIDQAKSFVDFIWLAGYGEPFFNNEIYKMIRYTVNSSIGISTSTNGSFLCKDGYKDYIRRIIDSKLNELIICLDGMDQQTITKFRDKLAIENLKRGIEALIKMKNNTENKLPTVIIQLILMKHNEHQREIIKRYSQDIGADYFYEKTCGIDVNDPDFHSLAERLLPGDMHPYRHYYRDSNGKIKLKKRKLYNRCSQVYSAMTINSDGTVVPCCYDLYNEIILGNAFKEGLWDIWNGQQYIALREKIKKERNKITICKRCNEFYSDVTKDLGRLTKITPWFFKNKWKIMTWKSTLSYDFIILANSHWDSGGGGNSSQQYARTMSKKGYSYVFIGPTEISKAYEIIKNPKICFAEIVVLCNLPRKDYFEVCKILKDKGCKIIYRIVDLWKHMPENEWYDVKVEYELIKLANLCYTSTQALLHKFKKIRSDIRLLPNGVDAEQFSRKPAKKLSDLKNGEITIGFWGMFWIDYFDWDLIKKVAREKPNWFFNIIGGKPAEIKSKIGNIPDNINLIGQKNWEDLYKYLYYFDVGIIPYICKDGSNESNPIKTLEYLAGYKPVVSYYNKSLMNIPYIYFYKGEKDFIDKIKLACNIKIDKIAVNNFINTNTWESRLDIILNSIKTIKNVNRYN